MFSLLNTTGEEPFLGDTYTSSDTNVTANSGDQRFHVKNSCPRRNYYLHETYYIDHFLLLFFAELYEFKHSDPSSLGAAFTYVGLSRRHYVSDSGTPGTTILCELA